MPERLPLEDGSADEVHLRGTFNAELADADVRRAVSEARRVLRDGGKIIVHTLVGDRPSPGAPSLPGPAAAVRRVPLEGEPLRALEGAGFTALHLAKFGAAPCFPSDGVQMREQLLEASRPAAVPTAR